MIKCCDVIEGLKELPDESIDVVIADVPYNIGKNFEEGGNDKMPIKKYISWCIEWTDECYRVMKDSASMFIYGFPEVLCHIASNLDREFRILQWHYTNKTVPTLNFWQRSHESIICTWKDKNQRIFNEDDVREPYLPAYTKLVGKTRKGTPGRFGEGKTTEYNVNELGAKPRDIIKVSALAGGAGMKERHFLCKTCDIVDNDKDKHEGHDIVIHPTQKPLALTEILLKSCKPKENGKVLVCFTGSGSECLAAKKLGMEYIGFDINSDYVKMANKLLEQSKY